MRTRPVDTFTVPVRPTFTGLLYNMMELDNFYKALLHNMFNILDKSPTVLNGLPGGPDAEVDGSFMRSSAVRPIST